MADNSEIKDPASKGADGAPAKSKKKMLIIIGIVVLVIVLGGGGAFMFLNKGGDGKAEKSKAEETVDKLAAEAEAEGEEGQEAHGEEQGEEGEGEHAADKSKHGEEKGKNGGAHGAKEGEAVPEEPGNKSLVLKMEPITANLNEPNFKRMVAVALVVEARDKKALQEVETHTFRITDSVISLLSNKTQADLRSEAGKDLLKREIKSRIDQILGKGKITFVGFQQFYFF